MRVRAAPEAASEKAAPARKRRRLRFAVFYNRRDAGLIRLHGRVAPGTRIEETERKFAEFSKTIRSVIPEPELDNLISNIGVAGSAVNLSMSDGTMISSADGEILIALKEHHRSTADYVRALRQALTDGYPNATFFFLPPDISTQVLNFGVSAPIDVQITGPASNLGPNLELAEGLLRSIRSLPGAVDVRLHQVPETPQLLVNVDRESASQLGLTQRDVANDLLVSRCALSPPAQPAAAAHGSRARSACPARALSAGADGGA